MTSSRLCENKGARFGVLLLCAALALAGCRGMPLERSTQVLMGTYVEVASYRPEAAGIVFAEFRRLEKLLSKYDPESEVSRLNRDGRVHASPDTFYIISRAKEFWEKSGGAFDVTVGPLVDLWGFTERNYRVPSPDEVRARRAVVGSDKIILHEKESVIEFAASGMKIDLGGIAKGYALDRSAAELKKAGITDCLINAGGQVYCLGRRHGRPWRIAVRDDSTVIDLEDQSVSTSGSEEQHFTEAGRRYSHIIDPRTGYPAETGIDSVTVIAADGLTADALSTAVFVLGKEKGEELVRQTPGATLERTHTHE